MGILTPLASSRASSAASSAQPVVGEVAAAAAGCRLPAASTAAEQRLQQPARSLRRSADRPPPPAERTPCTGSHQRHAPRWYLVCVPRRPWVTLSSTLPTTSAPAEVYRSVIWHLREAGIPYLVGGTYALEHHAGLVRDTKDLDLFVRRADWSRIARRRSRRMACAASWCSRTGWQGARATATSST